MEVSFGDTPIPIPIPTDAQHTEITTYMWPGFLGEYVHDTMEFIVWQLVGPNRWTPRLDIITPPRDCIGIETTKGWRWTCPDRREQWLAYPELALWRRLQL
jgi:hypothetical protein